MNISINHFCMSISPYLQMIGNLITIFKISLPFILIVLGVFDIAKAVISSKPESVRTYMLDFLKKLVICIIVFFIPTICMIVFSFVGEFTEIRKNSDLDFDVCYSCLFKPNNDDCTEALEIAMAEDE